MDRCFGLSKRCICLLPSQPELEEIQAGVFPIIRDFSRENNKKKRVPADPGRRNHLVSAFLCPVVELHGEKGCICVAFPEKGWYNLPVFLEVVV